jgi:hypothetical protein
MRKFALAAVAFAFTVGLSIAAEVVFVKFDKDKSEVTVKEGDKDVTYKVTETTKGGKGDKFDGEKYFSKAKEGKSKYDITVDKNTITEIKRVGGKKTN